MSPPPRSIPPIAPHQRRWVVATVMLGTVSTITAATIVNVAFPALIAQFHVGHDSLQWIAAGFLGAMTATMPASAWLIETQGQRRTFVAALAVFLASSALSAASWSEDVLIASRVLQGAAAGVLQPLAMVALFAVFPPDRRGSAMGLFGLGIVLVPAIGPSIGGILLQVFGWRSIFLLPLPFCIAGIALGARFLPGPHNERRRSRFDWQGFVLLAAALVALLNVPVVGHRAGWTSAATAVIALAGVLLVAGFVARELRVEAPMLALRLFASAGFRATALVALAYGLGLFGTTYLIPVFAQDIAGYSPSRAGALLIAPGLALAATIALAGRWADRIEPRRLVLAGLALFALSSLLLAFSGAATAFALLALWLLVGRVGLGMIIPALSVAAVQALDERYVARAASSVNFVRQLGGAIGVNLLAVLLEWRLGVHGAGGEVAAFQECFWVVTIAFVAATAAAWSIRKAPAGQ
ncbi:MAG TPA: DHA2 family efflux MFS transporter permease subunit [Casimicrobiaceae bacterium]|nr:DHA2 family efflux MFS transporter permease subunit [Casimicrobiaceae bacterium]